MLPAQRAALLPSKPVPPPPALPPVKATAWLRAAVDGAWARSPERGDIVDTGPA